MTKRFLSILLTLLLLLGNLHLFSFVASSESEEDLSQIVTEGNWVPEEYVTNGTLSNDMVAVKKSIAKTDKENYFDISLDIATNPTTWGQSVDVIVVMDISNSMNDSNRLKNAKNAVKQFVSEFAADERISSDREFSLVTFNSNVSNPIPFTPLTTEEQANSINKIIDGITAPDGNKRFTNIEGGLQMAHNIMKSSKAVYKYIILATDGFPTTYINRSESDLMSTTSLTGWYPLMSSSKYDKNRINEDGYFCNSVSKESVSVGIIYSDIGAQRAQAVASNIKADGINIFSIGINIGDYNKLSSYKTNRLDTRTTDYAIGNGDNSYKNWLGTAVAGGPNMTGITYVDGDNANGLKNAFTNILNQMENVAVEFKTDTAFTTDPMSRYVEFMNFYDSNGALQLIIENAEGEDVATFDTETDTIKWLLEKAEPVGTDEYGNLLYSLKYRLRLKNEEKDFEFSKAVPTNETTTLKVQTESSNGDVEDFEINYSIPEVKGFSADVVLVKQDAVTHSALAGAEFTLSHSSGCSVCGGEATISDKTVTSDSNGKVIFSNCPSGHSYVIKETKAPAGYVLSGTTYNVLIDYGVVTIDGEISSNDIPVVITNQSITPVEFKIASNVQLIGREMKPSEFVMALDSTTSNLTFSESHSNDENGNAQYTTIKFDKEGTYNLKGYQVIGNDPSVVYDTKEYDIQIKVTLNSEGTGFDIETTINGEAQENDATPDPLKYVNRVRESAKVVLEATKLFNGEAPEDGQFIFALKEVGQEVPVQSVKNTGSKVEFTELTFDNTGIYTYTISEVKGTDSKVYYDPAVYEVKVTVTKPEGDGAFEAKVEYSLSGESKEAVVFNNKTIKPVESVITSIVDIIGRDLVTGEFEMTLTGPDYNDPHRNDENGSATHQKFTFDEVGEYIYDGKQIIGTDETVIYDETEHKVVFKVTLNETGDALVLETIIDGKAQENDSNPDPLEYVNRVRGNATVTFTAEKYLDGKATDKKFTFELLDETGKVLQTVENVNEAITFDALSYNNAGTYTYKIREVAGTDYIVYDKNVYDVTVTVTKEADTFVADVKYSLEGKEVEAVVFNNTTIKPVTATITSNVDIIGRELKNEEFEMFFNGETIANDENGNATYQELTFDAPGEYVFNGYQIIGTDETVVYDETQYEVVFKVTLNEAKDGFVLETIINGEAVENDSNPDPLKYVNRVRESAKVKLEATKLFNGEVPEDDQFIFTLKETGQGVPVQSVKNTGSKVEFKELNFDKTGVYTYTISEVKGTDSKVYYDPAVYEVTVTVTKAEDSFEADVKYTLAGNEVESVVFNNKTIKPVESVITSKVDIIGRELEDEEFEMILVGKDFNDTRKNDENGNATHQKFTFDEVGEYIYDGKQIIGTDETVIYDETEHKVVFKVTLNETGDALVLETIIDGKEQEDDSNPEPLEYVNRVRGAATVTFTAEKYLDGKASDKKFTFELLDETGKVLQTVENVNEAITFDALSYNNAGTYTYKIREVAGTDYIVYDKNVYDVTVTVTKAEDSFIADVQYFLNGKEAEIVFNNTTIKPVDVTIKSHTDIDGRDLVENQFEMTFNDETKPNDKEGMAYFEKLTFDKEGTYTFEGEQIEGNDPTIIYDKTKYTVVVKVTLNEDRTEFVVETTINGKEQEDDSNPETLEYLNRVRDNATVVFTAEKYLDGKATDKKFTFELLDETGKVLQTVENVNEAITFDALSYNNAGTYTYKIREVAGTDYIVYDKNVYDVTVTVTKAEDSFIADVKYSLEGKEVESVVFNNTTIKPVDVTIKSHTDIDGRDLVENQFEMTFNDETKPNDKEGMAYFEKLTFDKEGTYTFEGEQIEGNDPTIIYDKTKYTVVVKVTLNEDRTEFVVETTINGKEQEDDSNPETLEYLNRVRDNATVVFTAEKYLDGKATDKKFTFELLDETGKVLQTVENVNEAITFDALSYNNAGTYTYKIREVAGTEYIVYDKTVYDVTVTVTKEADKFVADVKYLLNGNETKAVFNNTTIKPVEVVINSNTSLIGRDLVTGEFNMTLSDGVEYTETFGNDENGNAVYSTFKFEEEGTYTFKGHQEKGNDPSVVYDETTYTVVFTVKLNEDRTAFVVETTINGEDVENDTNPDPLKYVNRIRGNASLSFTVSKLLDGKAPKDGQFTFVLKDFEGNVVATATNVGSDVVFKNIVFDEIGTYKFTLSEVYGEDKSIRYDIMVYDVTVIVTAPEDNAGDLTAKVEFSFDSKVIDKVVFNNMTIPEDSKSPVTGDNSYTILQYVLIGAFVLIGGGCVTLALYKKSKEE